LAGLGGQAVTGPSDAVNDYFGIRARQSKFDFLISGLGDEYLHALSIRTRASVVPSQS
jgi:hypothetical protein